MVFETMALRFEISQEIEPNRLGAMWRDLEARADRPFYLSWDWIGCWMAETAIAPTVLIGRAGSEVVLLGILVPGQRRIAWPITIGGVHLHTTGELSQDVITIEYNGFLVDRRCSDAAQDEAIAFLFSRRRLGRARFDELHLYNVLHTHAAVAQSNGLAHAVIATRGSYRIDLEKLRETGRGYLDSLSSNTRQQIRRSVRLYEKRGPMEARRAEGVAETLAFLDGLKDLHQRYWVGKGQPGAFAYPFFERFQHRLIEACAPKGALELVKVTCGGDPIGYLYNFVDRGQVYAYQSGFQFDADPKLKPGLVSHTMCIEMHYREGAAVYDFMAGDSRYKANLGERGPDMRYVLLQRPVFSAQFEGALHRLKARIMARRERRAARAGAAEPETDG